MSWQTISVTIDAMGGQGGYRVRFDWGPVGADVVAPGTAFDKWRHLPVVDEEHRVVDVLETYF